ncbi:MAG TPA: methyltransferase domain-containing protein [Kiloniellales bacterium]|nr:methyltransferase domain-containing protein [Kiloniellales bacterium]
MAESDKAFVGSIPEIYDTYLVPLIFEPYAADLARRVAALRPQAVLETAAGTGVVARALAPQLPAGASYTVTDLNQPMLDRARQHLSGDKRLAWRQADALSLPFEDGSFDAVCCQFGVMFFPDRVAGHREALRVLKPGGRLLFNVWDDIAHNDFARLSNAAAIEIFPDDPPLFLERAPHGYHDEARLRADLETAGFGDIRFDTVTHRSEASSARHAVVGYVQGSPLRSDIEKRNPQLLERVTDRAAELVAQQHGTGAVSGRMQAIVVTARKAG